MEYPQVGRMAANPEAQAIIDRRFTNAYIEHDNVMLSFFVPDHEGELRHGSLIAKNASLLDARCAMIRYILDKFEIHAAMSAYFALISAGMPVTLDDVIDDYPYVAKQATAIYRQGTNLPVDRVTVNASYFDVHTNVLELHHWQMFESLLNGSSSTLLPEYHAIPPTIHMAPPPMEMYN